MNDDMSDEEAQSKPKKRETKISSKKPKAESVVVASSKITRLVSLDLNVVYVCIEIQPRQFRNVCHCRSASEVYDCQLYQKH